MGRDCLLLIQDQNPGNVDNDARTPKLKTARDVRALIAVCNEVGGDCDSRQLEAWLPGF